MMPRTNLFLALALSLSVASACDEAVEADFGEGDVSLRPGGFGSGGVMLNTSAIGDHMLHELNTMGVVHENVVLKGVYLKKTYFGVTWDLLDHVWVEKGQLFGRIKDVVYTGAALHGSRWDVLTYGGGVKERQMVLHSSRYDKVADIYKYTFGYPNDPAYGQHYYSIKKGGHIIDGTTLQAACDKDESGSLEAVLYEDLHVDMKYGHGKKLPDLINIACDGGAIAKAGLWGYRPYYLGVVDFIAGVRMVRADYCGDGDSWTKPGTAIELQDVWGYNKFFDPTHKTEAFWTAKGAACVYAPRRPEFDVSDVVCESGLIEECKLEWELADLPDAVMHTLFVQ